MLPLLDVVGVARSWSATDTAWQQLYCFHVPLLCRSERLLVLRAHQQPSQIGRGLRILPPWIGGNIDMGSRNRINWITVLLYVALITAGFGAALGLLSLTGQISLGKDAPAWVQAIGSIVAILIAVAVPSAQHYLTERKQEREMADKARSLGLMLLPHIQEFAERNNAVWTDEDPDEHAQSLGEDACVIGPLAESALNIPPAITAVISRIHELGPAAEGLQRAIYNVTRARELMIVTGATVEHLQSGPLYKSRMATYSKSKFYGLLWDTLAALTTSQNRIEAFFFRPSALNPSD